MAITESMLLGICDRFIDAADSGNYTGGVRQLAKDLKVHVAWEPTNPEKLAAVIQDMLNDHGRGIAIRTLGDALAVAEYLDANGVKAEGGK